MDKETAKRKYQAGDIQLKFNISSDKNTELLRFITGKNYAGSVNTFYYTLGLDKNKAAMPTPLRDFQIVNISEIEEEVVWLGSELQQWNELTGMWHDFTGVDIKSKFRQKPKPDYSKEIKALQEKAKENGMKAVITFEKL